MAVRRRRSPRPSVQRLSAFRHVSQLTDLLGMKSSVALSLCGLVLVVVGCDAPSSAQGLSAQALNDSDGQRPIGVYLVNGSSSSNVAAEPIDLHCGFLPPGETLTRWFDAGPGKLVDVKSSCDCVTVSVSTVEQLLRLTVENRNPPAANASLIVNIELSLDDSFRRITRHVRVHVQCLSGVSGKAPVQTVGNQLQRIAR